MRRQLRDTLRAGPPPTNAALERFIEDRAHSGLRFVCVAGPRRTLHAGTPLGPPTPAPEGADRLWPVGPRYRFELRTTPPRNLAVAFEFAPQALDALNVAARGALGLGVITAVLAGLLAWAYRRAAEARAHMATQLAQERHLASLGEMSAVLAHELKNPLTSLRGHAMLLEEQVDGAADGQRALDRLRERAFDVLLADLKMPGLALLSKVRAEQPDVQVILLAAHGTVDNAVQAMKAGAFDYMQKPVQSLSELRLIVERALERRALQTRADGARRAVETPPQRLTWGAPAMLPVVDALDKVGPTEATVLLTGESGTGKEVCARRLHALSPRHEGPFMAVNGATLSKELLASELFGHERGAFTGAHERRSGRIELAAGGTFFLDEVGELDLDVQAKLLRVIEARTFERLGSAQERTADVRFIAATNRDLGQAVAEGQFRQDLLHRLSVFPIELAGQRAGAQERPGAGPDPRRRRVQHHRRAPGLRSYAPRQP